MSWKKSLLLKCEYVSTLLIQNKTTLLEIKNDNYYMNVYHHIPLFCLNNQHMRIILVKTLESQL